MPNMSYCRFNNTLHDLDDCAEHLQDKVSSEETEARKRLVDKCREIVEEADRDGFPGDGNLDDDEEETEEEEE